MPELCWPKAILRPASSCCKEVIYGAYEAFPEPPTLPNNPESSQTTKSKWVPEKWIWNPNRKRYEWVLGHFEKVPQVTEDALKLLYERNCDQFKYYLTWRQLMFAGYFAIFSALAFGFRWTLRNSSAYSCICPFLGALVSLVLWALDHRNRELYEIVGDASIAIEKALGGPDLGYFSVYHNSPKGEKSFKPLKHQWILTVFYGIGGTVMLVAGIVSLIHPLVISIPAKNEVAPRLVSILGWL